MQEPDARNAELQAMCMQPDFIDRDSTDRLGTLLAQRLLHVLHIMSDPQCLLLDYKTCMTAISTTSQLTSSGKAAAEALLAANTGLIWSVNHNVGGLPSCSNIVSAHASFRS